MGKDKSDGELIQAQLDWIFWGGLIGAALALVAGAKVGAMIGGRWVERGAFPYLFGFIGAIIAAPLGFLLGCLLGGLLPEGFFALIALTAVMPRWWLQRRRTRIASFVANPNPVAAGNRLTLTACTRHRAVTEVAFYEHSLEGKTLLGCGTKTSPEMWELHLTVRLAPGSHTLVAQA